MTEMSHHDHAHRTPVQYFSLVMGLGFLLFGVLGFVPGATHMHGAHQDLTVDAGYGTLLGLFPVNVLHNVVHLLFGVWGVYAFTTFSRSRGYAASVAIIYAILAVMGLIPALRTTFGLIPIWGNDVWLHGIIAIAAAVFAFLPARVDDYGHGHTPHHA